MAMSTANPPGLPLPLAAAPAVRPAPLQVGFWGGHVAFWGAAFLVNLLVAQAFQDPPDSAGFILLEVACCLLATAAIRRLLPPADAAPFGPRQIGFVVVAAVVATLVTTAVLQAVSLAAGFPLPSPVELGGRMAISFAMLALWSGLFVVARLLVQEQATALRAAEAEAEALRSEVARLQSHVSSHFLFNALNTLAACRHEPEAIDSVTQALGRYLRFLMRPAFALEPLARELDALEDYLTIQAARFGTSLEARIDCDLQARAVEVPPALVQPLVENAIKYGFETAKPPIEVSVTARREGDRLMIEVANTGAWVAGVERGSTGTGLASLERRLQLLMGPAVSVSHAAEQGRVRVTVRLPVASPLSPPAGTVSR